MEEVTRAFSQMHPLKFLGPNGFVACFYQKLWTVMGVRYVMLFSIFLNSGLFDAFMNSTYIVFTLKVKAHPRVFEYRPISLCNIMYKIIAKVLANRLKKVLPFIISQN